MDIPIPAICENPNCRNAWFAAGIMSGTGTATMINCRMAPCPKCGGIGRVPDGQYNQTKGAVYNPKDLQLVLQALRVIQEKMTAGATAQEVKEEVAKNPILHPLKKYIPTNATEINGYLASLILIATLLENRCSGDPIPATNPAPVVNVYVQQEFSEVIEQACARQKTSPQKNQKTQPDTQSEQAAKN